MNVGVTSGLGYGCPPPQPTDPDVLFFSRAPPTKTTTTTTGEIISPQTHPSVDILCACERDREGESGGLTCRSFGRFVEIKFFFFFTLLFVLLTVSTESSFFTYTPPIAGRYIIILFHQQPSLIPKTSSTPPTPAPSRHRLKPTVAT